MGRRRTIDFVTGSHTHDLRVYRAEMARIPGVTEVEAKKAAERFVASVQKAKAKAKACPDG